MLTPSGLIVSRMRAASRRAAATRRLQVLLADVEKAFGVIARDNESMTAGCGIDVHECDGEVIGVDDSAGPSPEAIAQKMQSGPVDTAG